MQHWKTWFFAGLLNVWIAAGFEALDMTGFVLAGMVTSTALFFVAGASALEGRQSRSHHSRHERT